MAKINKGEIIPPDELIRMLEEEGITDPGEDLNEQRLMQMGGASDEITAMIDAISRLPEGERALRKIVVSGRQPTEADIRDIYAKLVTRPPQPPLGSPL